MRKNTTAILTTLAATLILFQAGAGRAVADPITFNFVTSNGTIPGSGVTYAIASTGTLMNFGTTGASNNNLFQWQNPLNLYEGTTTITTTITFSQAIAVDQVVTGLLSIVNGGTSFSLSVAGGTATTNDFTVTDGLRPDYDPGGQPMYNPTTGSITATMGPGSDQGLILGSTSLHTLTSLTITGNDNGNGWTNFIGVTTPAVPEPSSLVMCGLAGLIGSAYAWRRRTRAATV